MQFVLVTAAQSPSAQNPHFNTKFDMKNLVVVFREEVENKLGIIIEGEKEPQPGQRSKSKQDSKAAGGSDDAALIQKIKAGQKLKAGAPESREDLIRLCDKFGVRVAASSTKDAICQILRKHWKAGV